ncbi:thioredoxin domain-containing protein [Qipengyuania sp. DGS5-3]|uniref:thioredoxin domain-containing protein n=1 Tax=Qipengyuania sp. DGS5-3 TaxID=3349632 RepID=UPI0036D3D7AE
MALTRRFTLGMIAAPLALGLAACSSADADEAAIDAEPIAEIAAPEGTEWTDVVEVSEYDGYVIGNPDAPIKVIEYASLTCPACAAFSMDGAAQLKAEYVSTGRVSYELRNQIHGPHDLMLAQLVRCGADESFHPLSDQVWADLNGVLGPVFQNQDAFGQALQLPEAERFVAAAEVAGFYDFFAARGVSEDQARTCLADFQAMETIANNSNTQGQEFGVTGTPTFFVNGVKQDGVLNWAGLEPILQRAGAR